MENSAVGSRVLAALSFVLFGASMGGRLRWTWHTTRVSAARCRLDRAHMCGARGGGRGMRSCGYSVVRCAFTTVGAAEKVTMPRRRYTPRPRREPRPRGRRGPRHGDKVTAWDARRVGRTRRRRGGVRAIYAPMITSHGGRSGPRRPGCAPRASPGRPTRETLHIIPVGRGLGCAPA